MSQKNIILITIVGLVLVLGIWGVYNFFINKEVDIDSYQETADFDVDTNKKVFVLKSQNIFKVEVKAVPTGTNVPENKHQSLGEMRLVSDDGKNQRWELSIPKAPLSISEVFAVLYNEEEKEVERKKLPYSGATDIYNALWLQIPFREIELSVGEFFSFGGSTVKLTKIIEDSRCPIGVECIQAGRFVVSLSVSRDDLVVEEVELSSTDGRKQIGNYNVSLVSVKPTPVSDQKINTKDYRIKLYITNNI